MSDLKIYYYASCSKCRQTYELIKTKGKDAEIIDYLNHPPSEETLKEIVKVLGIKPFELVRKNEPLYIEKYEGKKISNTRWFSILSKNPILIQRPIVIEGNKAIIGRPPERVLELI
ncbi:MAG: arsenate reductase family protein [Bacteroidia bacterium]